MCIDSSVLFSVGKKFYESFSSEFSRQKHGRTLRKKHNNFSYTYSNVMTKEGEIHERFARANRIFINNSFIRKDFSDFTKLYVMATVHCLQQLDDFYVYGYYMSLLEKEDYPDEVKWGEYASKQTTKVALNE